MGSKKLTIVSLFSGAGGLDLAACQTGFVGRLFSTDSNPVFLDTASNNIGSHFPEVIHTSLAEDARKLNGKAILKLLNTDEVDIVIGGPPCDDFTYAGRRRGEKGDKAPLIMDFARLVLELRPKSFLFENVPNLAKQFKGFFEIFLNNFQENYKVRREILGAMDFGSPTTRERVFAIGFLNNNLGVGFQFPEPTHGNSSTQMPLFTNKTILKKHNTVENVLSDLPDAAGESSGNYYNHTVRQHRPKTIQHIMTVPQGVGVKKSFRYRAPWDGLCRSLTAGLDNTTKAYIHPIFHREMTVREYARIHDFPDSWVFNGTRDNGIKQVANAVPIRLGQAILDPLVELLREC